MRRPDEAAEVAEVEVAAVAAEFRMPSEAADISAAAECAWAVAAADHAWAAARLTSPAGRHRTLQRAPLSAASVRLLFVAVRTGPPTVPQR